MSPSRKSKSVESLEDAFLKALDLDDSQAPEESKPAGAPGPGQRTLAAAPDDASPSAIGRQGMQLLLAADNMSVSLALTGREQLSVSEIHVVIRHHKV